MDAELIFPTIPTITVPTIDEINSIYDRIRAEQDLFDTRLEEIKTEYYSYNKQNMDDSLKVLKTFVTSLRMDTGEVASESITPEAILIPEEIQENDVPETIIVPDTSKTIGSYCTIL